MSPARAVFFDRDGTLMEEVHYCGDPARVRVFPGVPEALRKLKEAGFRAFIVTNQSGIARGLITEAQYHAVQLYKFTVRKEREHDLRYKHNGRPVQK